MKKRRLIFGIIGVLFLIFIIVTALNVLVIKSKQPSPQPTDVVINEAKAVEHLSKAITYKTISYQDRNKFDFAEFDKFISFLEESYPSVHNQLELEKINEYALFYQYKGSESSKNPIGLTSHYDVVPVLEGSRSELGTAPFLAVLL